MLIPDTADELIAEMPLTYEELIVEARRLVGDVAEERLRAAIQAGRIYRTADGRFLIPERRRGHVKPRKMPVTRARPEQLDLPLAGGWR